MLEGDFRESTGVFGEGACGGTVLWNTTVQNMVCFYHPERAAHGICKHCGRGLCNECTALVDDSLACKDRHEEDVRGLNLIAARGILQARRLGSGFARNAIFYGLVGLLFAGFGLVQYRYLGLQAIFFMLIGLFLLYAAAANFLEGRKYR